MIDGERRQGKEGSRKDLRIEEKSGGERTQGKET